MTLPLVKKRIAVEGSEAIALAVKLADVDVIAAYPITPQTHIVEILSRYVANGELSAEYIEVESEHSALSACIGAAATGSRTFTSSSAQGLALMHEVLFIASGMRLPIVMAVANRALSAPLNIWCDHQDSVSQRDTGWIQLYVESPQEAFDTVLQAFKIAETVYLPVMVCLDGFTLSHVIESIEPLEKEEVDRFLKRSKPKYVLDPKKPVTMGAYATPEYYTEFRRQQEEAMSEAREVIKQVNEEYSKLFGRSYGDGLLEAHKLENAEIILVTLGSLSQLAKVVTSEYKGRYNVGVLRVRSFRPLPINEIRALTKNAKVLAVISRDLSPGSFGGALLSEIRSVLYHCDKRPRIYGYIMGLGGRDIKPEDVEEVIKHAERIADGETPESDFIFIGLK